MSITNESIQQQLTDKFGDSVSGFHEPYGMLTFEAPKEMNLKVLQYLYDSGFEFLNDLCAVHYPDNKGAELAMVYMVLNMREGVRVRFKVYTDIQQPDIFTAVNIWSAANWMERETYDFYGVNFIGHPNLKRIVNDDAMDYFPQRKEYPLEDQTRRDKDDEMFGRGGKHEFLNT